MEVPAGEARDVFIPRDKFEELLTLAPDPSLRDLMEVTYATGCRPQESLRLEIRHVDLKHQRWVSDVAVAHYRLGTYYDVVGDAANAKKHFESCRELRKLQVELSANDSNKKSLMLALARCGDIDEARELIDALGKSTARSGELHLERARALAQLSRHLANEQERVATIDAAFVALERAIKEGFSDPFRIQAEQDLDPLHEDPRFQALVESVH